MSRTAPPGGTWRKSSHSQPAGEDCVEVAGVAGGCAVRDSKDPDGPTLTFDRATWSAFLAGVKQGGSGQG